MGKQISSSQTSRVRRRSPDPSAPKTKATRSVKGNSVIEFSDSPANPKHEILIFCIWRSALAMFVTLKIGKCSVAPDADFANTPSNRGAFLLCRIIPSAPKAAAERAIAPTL